MPLAVALPEAGACSGSTPTSCINAARQAGCKWGPRLIKVHVQVGADPISCTLLIAVITDHSMLAAFSEPLQLRTCGPCFRYSSSAAASNGSSCALAVAAAYESGMSLRSANLVMPGCIVGRMISANGLVLACEIWSAVWEVGANPEAIQRPADVPVSICTSCSFGKGCPWLQGWSSVARPIATAQAVCIFSPVVPVWR